MIVPWQRGGAPKHQLDDALSAITAADWASDDAPVAWMHWPVDMANPFQGLIYSRFAQHNLVPLRVHDFGSIDRLLAALPTDMTKVLHVHWLYAVTAGSVGETDALARVERFETDVESLRERGIRLVWTVHNLLPHETVYPAAEARLRRFMLRAAEVVHVMDASHVEVLRDTFDLAPRVAVVVPHPSFVGAYPDWTDRRTARAHLGIPLGARVLATVGQIRPYKGHQAFLEAFDLAAQIDPHLRWLVAGKVRDEPGGLEFMQAALEHPAVVLYPRFVSERDIQFFLRAADAAVFPYLSSLNSGAAALAASFDLPAYASIDTSLGQSMPDEAVVRFNLADRQSAAETIAGGFPGEPGKIRTMVRERAQALTAAAVSERLAAAMREHLGEPDGRTGSHDLP